MRPIIVSHGPKSKSNDAEVSDWLRSPSRPVGSGCGCSDTLRDAFRCIPSHVVVPWVLVVPSVVAWDNRVEAISPVAKIGIPVRLEHAQTMRAHSATPSSIPECSRARAAAPPAPPAPLPLLYSDVAWRQSMAVTTVLWNLDGDTLAAAISARERNYDRTISRNHGPRYHL
jgi:hypothetical protein